jgi:small conductance mechanosensitive channel
MKKFQTFSLLYILNIIYFSEFSFAAVWWSELEQSQANANIILSFFSTELLLNIIFACVTIVLTFLLSKIVTSRLTSYLEKSYAWEESGREELVWVLSRTVNISILSIWFAITLTILWIDMWIFMWWLWFGIGFTLKIFLTNFVAWILMVTQWFYHLWDIIEVWGRTWTIKKIHALFTAVEQFDWVVYYIPNVKFLEEDVSNFHSNDKRRVDIKIWVDYSTDIVKAKKIMIQVIEKFPNILQAPTPEVLVEDLWDNSIKLSLRFWINSKDAFFVSKSNVIETINMAFKQAWIVIPFPQITVSNRTDIKLPA